MTLVTINPANIAPNLHPNRQSSSTYFSYVRRWAGACDARHLPPTMRNYERSLLNSRISRFLGHEGFEFDTEIIGFRIANITEHLCRTDIVRIFDTNRTNSNAAMVKLIAALNIWAQFATAREVNVRHKVDFIQTVGTRTINDRSWDMAGSSMARISANFNGRCVLRITDAEFMEFILVDCAETFLRRAGELYNSIPRLSACQRPRYARMSHTARPTAPRRERGVGGHTGHRRELVESADIPNGRLANEYHNRQDIDDSIPQNQLAAMLQEMELPSDICNQIHELLIATQIGCEETAETVIAS